MTARRWRRCMIAVLAVSLISLVIVGVVTARAPGPRGPVPVILSMTPAPPLNIAGCMRELTPYGFSSHGAAQLCSLGKGRTWYRALLTNNSGGTYPLCRVSAFDSSGKLVFSGPLFLDLGGGITGLYVHAHRSVFFSWYLPDVSRPVARYAATCTANENPPI